MAARPPQFRPAVHWRTRSFFLTLRRCGCQLKTGSKGREAMRTRILIYY
jgi:hypothetical protein